MRATVSVNGRITDAASATASVFDHGFLYGEGVYETLRTYRREPFLFDRHLVRLRQSAAALALPVPLDDAGLRARIADTLAAHAPAGEAYIRLLLTRGVGELSYRLTATREPTLVVIVKDYTPQPAEAFTRGIAVALVGVRRNPIEALSPLIKSNNLLNNAMAMQEAYARGADEALMQNVHGHLVECAQSNVFLVTGGAVRTPPLSDGLLPGITRQFVMELATGLGIDCREAVLRPADLARASEAFLTGTTREVTPIVRVDDQPIGDGRPGPVTARVMAAFREHVQVP
jgi:branched-chain amino acid aminotransferase